MAYVPDNPNSVTIMETCCQFQTDYPDRLNGIISEDEYQESITNINRVVNKPGYYITICVLFTVVPFIGTLSLIYLLLYYWNPKDDPMYFLFFGVVILLLGPAITYVVLDYKQSKRIKKAINEESKNTRYDHR